jgi:hypothetical protein
MLVGIMGERHSSLTGAAPFTARPVQASTRAGQHSPIRSVGYLILVAVGALAVMVAGLGVLDLILDSVQG